jgi:hypothetical protein
MIRAKYVLLIFITASAALSGRDNSDPGIKSMEYVVRSAITNHPDIELMTLKRQQIAAGRKIASQIPNPELNTRLLYDINEKGISGEYGLFHTFETGDKRTARVDRADTEIVLFDKSILLKKQDIARDIIILMHRIRQVKEETLIIQRSGKAYEALLAGMNKLPGLTPQQSAAREIYRLALNECAVLLKSLRGEETSLMTELEWAAGEDFGISDVELPLRIKEWPAVQEKTDITGPILDLAIAEKNLSIAEYRIAETGTLPNLSAGPVIAHKPVSGNTSYEAGFSLSVTMPLYHRNSGEMDSAEAKKKYFELNEKIQKKRILQLRSVYLKRYNNLTDKNSLPAAAVNTAAGRERIYAQVYRGVLPASILIEYNRQEYDLLKTTHVLEIQALESLLSIYAIDGVIFREAGYDK